MKPVYEYYLYMIVLNKWIQLVDAGELQKAEVCYRWVCKFRREVA